MTSAIIPELMVQNAISSVKFYTKVLGFHIKYDRKDQGFYCLKRESVELMIEEVGNDVVMANETPPFGRGMHLQITVIGGLSSLYQDCHNARTPIVRDIEETWYRVGREYHGQAQFAVSDPDGYVLRFAEDMGVRETPPTSGRIVS